jgi:hypothetical protein
LGGNTFLARAWLPSPALQIKAAHIQIIFLKNQDNFRFYLHRNLGPNLKNRTMNNAFKFLKENYFQPRFHIVKGIFLTEGVSKNLPLIFISSGSF